MAAPNDVSDPISVTLQYELNRPVGAISYPTVQVVRLSQVGQPSPKVNLLHPPGYDHSDIGDAL